MKIASLIFFIFAFVSSFGFAAANFSNEAHSKALRKIDALRAAEYALLNFNDCLHRVDEPDVDLIKLLHVSDCIIAHLKISQDAALKTSEDAFATKPEGLTQQESGTWVPPLVDEDIKVEDKNEDKNKPSKSIDEEVVFNAYLKTALDNGFPLFYSYISELESAARNWDARVIRMKGKVDMDAWEALGKVTLDRLHTKYGEKIFGVVGTATWRLPAPRMDKDVNLCLEIPRIDEKVLRLKKTRALQRDPVETKNNNDSKLRWSLRSVQLKVAKLLKAQNSHYEHLDAEAESGFRNVEFYGYSGALDDDVDAALRMIDHNVARLKAIIDAMPEIDLAE